MTERLYVDSLPKRQKLARAVWGAVYWTVFRWSPGPLFERWRIFLLRLFGASIGSGCRVAPSCRVWAPWKLAMGNRVCFAEGVDCYCVSPIRIGSDVTISQRSFLCTASHDISSLRRPLVHAPITIADHAWVCSEAFVGPGVTLGEGAVVAARAVVTRDVDAWAVVAGSPARFVKKRLLTDPNGD